MQKIIGDLGAAFSIGPVRIGGALGIYGAMADLGATSSAQLATATGLAERYLREWLWHQAASRLRGLRRADRPIHAPAGTCLRARRSAEPCIRPARLLRGSRAVGQLARGDAGISNRKGRGVG